MLAFISKSDLLVGQVQECYDLLHSEANLGPTNPKINRYLSKLVDSITQPWARRDIDRILLNDEVNAILPDMWNQLARAEAKLEEHYSDRFLSQAKLSASDLDSFLYYGCYDRLVQKEVDEMRAGTHEMRLMFHEGQSLCFVGSGPLPLSPILTHYRTGLPVTCLDVDEEAILRGRQLVKKLGLEDHITFRCAAGETYNYRNHPGVFIASLAEPKEKIVSKVFEDGETDFLAIRTTIDLNRLLYKPINLFNPDQEIHTFQPRSEKKGHETINHTIFIKANCGHFGTSHMLGRPDWVNSAHKKRMERGKMLYRKYLGKGWK